MRESLLPDAARTRYRLRAAALGICLLGFVACDGGDDSTTAPSDAAVDRRMATVTPPATASRTVSPASTTSPMPPGDADADGAPSPTSAEPEASEVVGGLERPWGLALLPDGGALITEQDSGRVLSLGTNGELEQVRQIDVDPRGEGGLLGIAIAADFPETGMVYAYASTGADNRVIRFRANGAGAGAGGSGAEEPEAIVTGIPHGSNHNGGRIAFGPDGLLYVGTGDAGDGERAQDADSLGGKILRMTPDGDVPADNASGTLVHSLGHRNVQGLAWDASGQLFASELGPNADDEINRITPGGNYGWPVVTGVADREDFVDPVYVQQPPEASWSGMALSPDPAIPQWAGDLMVAALRGQRLWHLQVTEDGSIDDADALFIGDYGRLRTVAYAPDGSLWLITSNTDIYGNPRAGDDRIIRLAPQGR